MALTLPEMAGIVQALAGAMADRIGRKAASTVAAQIVHIAHSGMNTIVMVGIVEIAEIAEIAEIVGIVGFDLAMVYFHHRHTDFA